MKNKFKKNNKEWKHPNAVKNQFKKGHNKSENWRKKVVGRKPWNKGLKGFGTSWNTGLKRSEETKKKISLARVGKGGRSGDKNPAWKGGITRENHKERTTIEYKLWIHSVFARDSWTCQKTGVRGDFLVAHHIQNFAQYPELRFAIDNGITFSRKSHNEFHKKYGRKNNTKEQLIEFLS